jgi:hypothetical protein
VIAHRRVALPGGNLMTVIAGDNIVIRIVGDPDEWKPIRLHLAAPAKRCDLDLRLLGLQQFRITN